MRRTQREIAWRVGITQASLSNYERGKRDMPISTLFALTAVLGMQISELVCPAASDSDGVEAVVPTMVGAKTD